MTTNELIKQIEIDIRDWQSLNNDHQHDTLLKVLRSLRIVLIELDKQAANLSDRHKAQDAIDTIAADWGVLK